MPRHHIAARSRKQTDRPLFSFFKDYSEGIPGDIPQVGEVRRAKELGYKGWARFIWTLCRDCGAGRWVQFNKAQSGQFRCYACAGIFRAITKRGPQSINWRGGRHVHSGYVLLFVPLDHKFRCMARTNGYVPEHRLVMAESLGRPLMRSEVVHHKNGVKDDNRLENLEIMSKKGHASLHGGGLAAMVVDLKAEVARLKADNAELRAKLDACVNA